MWDHVQHELAALEWGAGPDTTRPGLLADWSATVTALLAARRAVGPLHDPADPFAVLATLTRGTQNTAGGEPLPAPTLAPLRAALGDIATAVDRTPVTDRADQLATLTQVAYRLTHWTRTRVPRDYPTHPWLLTAETVLDGAVHAPALHTPLARSLAGWRTALAEVAGRPEPLFRRGATLGHLRLLKSTHTSLDHALRLGVLPEGFGRSVVDAVRHLAHTHQATLNSLAAPPPARPSTADQLLMLRLGRSIQDLTSPHTTDELPGRLDALLRTSFGHAPLVAALAGQPAARQAADRLHRLTLEYLNHPQLLTPPGPRRPTPTRTPPPPPPAPSRSVELVLVQATIAKGTVLAPETVVALCRARDLGVAAATADPTQPPEILRGTDPATWPALAHAGRQAVADLVASVTPMVYAHARHGRHLDDLRGELFVTLVQAAHRFDPTRSRGAAWPTYAWRTLQYQHWAGVDAAGVPRTRTTPHTTPLGDRELASRTPGPEDTLIASPRSHAALTEAIAALPHHLRGPLEASMNGLSSRTIAGDLRISESTAHRRLTTARNLLRDQLGNPDGSPHRRLFETVTPPATPPTDPPRLGQPGRATPPR